MKERSRSTFFFAFAVLLSFILGSCTGSSETQAPEGGQALPSAEIAAPTLDATARPTEAVSMEITPAPDPQEVLAACPPEGQAEAMRPGSETDWEQINLSTCYDLEFVFSSGPPGYSGTARVTYLNLEAGEVPDLVFRLYPNASRIYGGELQVTAVRVDGAPAEHEIFLEDRTALRVSLGRPVLTGEALLVELEFTGQVPVDLEGQTGVYGIFNFDSIEEVLTLANGYPILAIREEGGWIAEPVVGIGDAVVSQAALYRVQVAAPDGWQVIGTGTAREGSTSEGEFSAEFTTGPVREFTLVAGPNFIQDQEEVDGVQVRHWGLPGGEDRWGDSLQAAVDSILLFDDRFGLYPYQELDVVAVPLRLAAGVEYPGLILLRQSLYQTGPESSPGLEYVVAHEVAHQWWYGVVGNNVLEHPWVDEGLASFSSLLYLEEYDPRAYTGTVLFYRQRVAEVESEAGDTGIHQPVDAFRDNLAGYSPVVYLKGSLFFEALRDQLGEAVFFEALRSYYEQNKFGLPAPQALLGSFEAACSCGLDELYQEWGAK
jgi:hypothetical protein